MTGVFADRTFFGFLPVGRRIELIVGVRFTVVSVDASSRLRVDFIHGVGSSTAA